MNLISEIWGAKDEPEKPYVVPVPKMALMVEEVEWIVDHLNEWIVDTALGTLCMSNSNVINILETYEGLYQVLRQRNIPYWCETNEKMEMLLRFRRIVIEFENRRNSGMTSI